MRPMTWILAALYGACGLVFCILALENVGEGTVDGVSHGRWAAFSGVIGLVNFVLAAVHLRSGLQERRRRSRPLAQGWTGPPPDWR